MARTVVFVDDAVRGELPPVCAKTGAPATRTAVFSSGVGGGNPLLLLFLFFGPIGWLILLFAWPSRETLTVRLPISDAATVRWAALRRDRRLAVGAVALSLVALVAALRYGGEVHWLVFGIVAAAALAWLVTHWRLNDAGVDLSLDASRRWVTLSGVHDGFAAAVRADQAARSTRSTT